MGTQLPHCRWIPTLTLQMLRPAVSVLAGLSVLILGTPGLAQLALSPSQMQPGRRQTQTTNRTATVPISVFQTPKRGMPGRRAGGGTRGDDCIQGSVPFLLALLPRTNLGLTTHAYPSFFWYVPQTTAQQAEFQLFQGNDPGNDVVNGDLQDPKLLYATTVAITGGNQIASLTLPNQSDVAPLAVGQDYQWSLALICDPANRDRDLRVEGWVQRVADNWEASPDLPAVNPYDRVAHYAEQGIWFDALATLHSLRCQQPQDEALTATWEGFLSSVGLSPVAKQPVSQTCRLATTPGETLGEAATSSALLAR